MKIDSYSFARIVINGKTSASDVIIYPTGLTPRSGKEDHFLQLLDVVISSAVGLEVVVICTIYAGIMGVPGETIDRISTQGMR